MSYKIDFDYIAKIVSDRLQYGDFTKNEVLDILKKEDIELSDKQLYIVINKLSKDYGFDYDDSIEGYDYSPTYDSTILNENADYIYRQETLDEESIGGTGSRTKNNGIFEKLSLVIVNALKDLGYEVELSKIYVYLSMVYAGRYSAKTRNILNDFLVMKFDNDAYKPEDIKELCDEYISTRPELSGDEPGMGDNSSGSRKR